MKVLLVYNNYIGLMGIRKIAETLKAVHIVSEFDPYSKSGGLASAVSGMASYLAKLGVEVHVIVPMFGGISAKLKQSEMIFRDVPIKVDRQTTITCSYVHTQYKVNGAYSLNLYFVNHYDFFGRYRRYFYSHRDTPKRFYFFSLAALELLKLLKLKPDIIHTHDWMTALVPDIISTRSKYYFGKGKKQPKTLLTIHNLAFQGSNYVNIHRFDKQRLRKVDPLPLFQNDKGWERVNFMRRGLLAADEVNTVSPQYALEITTTKLGEGLQQLLKKRRPVPGIINGIDHKNFDPITSKYLEYNFNSINFKKNKLKNKEYVLSRLKLPKRNLRQPFIVMVHRLAYQKGYDLVIESIEELMKRKLTLAVIGEGDRHYINIFKSLAKKYPRQIYYRDTISERLEHRLDAAADFMLLPSVYEPCGTAHLKAMRYGVVSIAHRVGGLADTIYDYDSRRATGTGFLFDEWTSESMLEAIDRALEVYKEPERWQQLVRRNMAKSHTWEQPALEYYHLYRQIIKGKFRSTH